MANEPQLVTEQTELNSIDKTKRKSVSFIDEKVSNNKIKSNLY